MFVIHDPVREGYAIKDPLEGWIFTILKQHAAQFKTKKEAEETIRHHYLKWSKRLVIKKME